MSIPTSGFAALLVVATFALTSCGSDDGTATATAPATGSAAVTTVTQTATATAGTTTSAPRTTSASKTTSTPKPTTTSKPKPADDDEAGAGRDAAGLRRLRTGRGRPSRRRRRRDVRPDHRAAERRLPDDHDRRRRMGPPATRARQGAAAQGLGVHEAERLLGRVGPRVVRPGAFRLTDVCRPRRRGRSGPDRRGRGAAADEVRPAAPPSRVPESSTARGWPGHAFTGVWAGPD